MDGRLGICNGVFLPFFLAFCVVVYPPYLTGPVSYIQMVAG